ncbi:hypothetical protein [Priestia koreensis]|uniref:LAGLIDADG homing endonuclease n=2 Tax=Priestia koreensis TaxID=284581 RepID=A0A0M0LAN2_9BACI|nr:hypothetical protein AMD01_04965 [Priestia koreensis]
MQYRMEIKKERLRDLILACLLAEGEIERGMDGELTLSVEMKCNVLSYLETYISEYDLGESTKMSAKRGQVKITSNDMEAIYASWYQGGFKIFSNRMNPKNMTFQAIILSLNLFGVRKYESLHLKTSIQKEKLPMLTHILRYHIGDVSIVPGQREIKIFNVVQLFGEHINQLTVMDSFYLFRFLSVHDRKKLRA